MNAMYSAPPSADSAETTLESQTQETAGAIEDDHDDRATPLTAWTHKF